MSGQKGILVVDDDLDVLRCVAAILGSAGFKVHVGSDGVEGLERFHKYRDELCMVLTDIMMPKKNGVELALAISAIDSSIPILLMSGYSDAAIEEEGRRAFPIIRKPFLAGPLIQKVRECIVGGV